MAKKRRTNKPRPRTDKPVSIPANVTAEPKPEPEPEPESNPKPEPRSNPNPDLSRGAKRRAELRRTASLPGPSDGPMFWFGFEISWAKLVLARVVIFGLLAADAVLAIRHAPRYGAGGFNVGQLPFLDGVGAGRVGYEVGQLLCAYLFVLAALGVATRAVVPIVAAIYAWLYFGSQLDSYQHHYLIVLVLLEACFVPWQRPDEAEPATPVRSWAVRLILVQLAIMYLWAAISKFDAAWLDGRTLDGQISGSIRELIDNTVGIKLVSRLVVFAELTLAATVWLRPAWIVAAPLGLAFHFGITRTNLEIGLFGYLMLGIYVLVVPDVIWVWLANTPPLRAMQAVVRTFRSESGVAWGAGALCVAVATALAVFCRFDHAVIVGMIVALVPIVLGVVARLRARPARPLVLAAAQLIAIALWLLVDRTSSVAFDYYRFWGGSQRRLGNLESAERAYRRLVEVAPEEPIGHYQLGRLLLGRDQVEQGLVELHEAERLEPVRARSWIEEATWLARKGRTAEAIEKAREATYAEPASPTARGLLDSLSGKVAKSDAAQADEDNDTP